MYTPEELENLNADVPPEPKTKKEPNEIMRLFHVAVNEPDVICCVCDQFLRICESKLVPAASLPPSFFLNWNNRREKMGLWESKQLLCATVVDKNKRKVYRIWLTRADSYQKSQQDDHLGAKLFILPVSRFFRQSYQGHKF